MVRLGLASLAGQKEKETEGQGVLVSYMMHVCIGGRWSISGCVGQTTEGTVLNRGGDLPVSIVSALLRGIFHISLLAGLHPLRQEERLPHSQALKEKMHHCHRHYLKLGFSPLHVFGKVLVGCLTVC